MAAQLTLLPLGGPDANLMGLLAAQLTEKGFVCRALPGQLIPSDALDPVREQYRAEPLLEMVRGAAAGRVLGVVDADLYAEGLNFVFGIAESPGRAAVIALARLRLGADEALFQTRMFKEAMHELGHTYGLRHCTKSACVMYFSNTLADTDRKGADYCPVCRPKLERLSRR
jgi:archaemetzincin